MGSLKYYYLLYNKYGDDQINIFKVGNYHVFMVADGVSECQLGRIASIIACSKFEEFFKESVIKSNHHDLETIIMEGLNIVGQTMIKTNHNLRGPSSEQSVHALTCNMKDFIHVKGYYEENSEQLVNNKIDELKHKLRDFLESCKDFSFETTLGLMVVKDDKFYSAALGDIQIYMFRKNKLLPHYILPQGGIIDTYLSSDRGLVGPIDLATRKIERDDILIICSDGANLSYAPGGGYPYALFINILTKSIQQGLDPANQWFARLKKEYGNNLPDDISLIIIKVE